MIVQVDKGCSQARAAVKSGLLKNWYVHHHLGCINGKGNDVEFNVLTDALANWKKLSVITEREAAQMRCNMQLQGIMQHQPMFLQEGWEDLLIGVSLQQL